MNEQREKLRTQAATPKPSASTSTASTTSTTSSLPPRPAFAGRTRSPCISVCKIDPDDGLCIGCQRTIDEIASWGAMAPEQRTEVWAKIAERKSAKAAASRASGK